MNDCSLMFRTLLIALLSIGLWATTALSDVRYDRASLSYLASMGGDLSVEKTDYCCHQPADDVCRSLFSRNSSVLLTPKQPAPYSPTGADIAYTDLMPDRLLCEIGTACYPDLPHSIITSPVYLATLRLRL